VRRDSSREGRKLSKGEMLTSQKRNSRKPETRHGKVEKSTATRCDQDSIADLSSMERASLMPRCVWRIEVLKAMKLCMALHMHYQHPPFNISRSAPGWHPQVD